MDEFKVGDIAIIHTRLNGGMGPIRGDEVLIKVVKENGDYIISCREELYSVSGVMLMSLKEYLTEEIKGDNND